MKQQTQQPTSLPPLWFTPQWASANAPDSEVIERIYTQVETLVVQLNNIRASIGTVPWPEFDALQALPINEIQAHLHGIVVALRELEYPSALTSWIDNARSHAARAMLVLDTAICQQQRLLRLSLTGGDYDECMSNLRLYTADAIDLLDHLHEHLGDYNALQSSTEPVERPLELSPEAIWRQGHRDGLYEAIELVQDMFLSHVDTYSPSARQAVEIATGWLLKELGTRIHQERSIVEVIDISGVR